MTISDTLIRQILADNPLPRKTEASQDDDAPFDDILPRDIFVDALPLEIFRDREPDAGEEFPDPPNCLALLGTYRWMASPGLITLYRHNIDAYWKSLINYAQRQFPFITAKDAERVLRLLVSSVYQHERFHYVCDFSRRMLNGAPDRWHEEALAVAWEWQWQKSQAWNSDYGLMHPTLRHLIVRAMFDHRAPGYRDWRQFANSDCYYNAVTAYLYPVGPQTFAGTNFNFGRWAVSHVPDDGNRAWEEQISG